MIHKAKGRKHTLTERMKSLAASALARKIGYLRIEDFPNTNIFDGLPTLTYNANRVLRSKDELFLIKQGSVEIWHTRYDRMVKELGEGTLFGEMNLLGQTMLGTRAITGTEGARVAVMNLEAAKEWIRADPISIFAKLGNKLAYVEAEHYRSRFQLTDSRVAALLLELAGEGSTIEGYNHAQLGEKIGVYRETATTMLNAMKADKLIEIGRLRITILDKKALRELSEL